MTICAQAVEDLLVPSTIRITCSGASAGAVGFGHLRGVATAVRLRAADRITQRAGPVEHRHGEPDAQRRPSVHVDLRTLRGRGAFQHGGDVGAQFLEFHSADHILEHVEGVLQHASSMPAASRKSRF